MIASAFNLVSVPLCAWMVLWLIIGTNWSASLGLTRVVNTSLDDVIQGVSTGCLLAPQLAIYFLGQGLGHMVVVLGQVRKLLVIFIVELEVVVCVSERHDCFLTLQREGNKECSQDVRRLIKTWFTLIWYALEDKDSSPRPWHQCVIQFQQLKCPVRAEWRGTHVVRVFLASAHLTA